MNKRALVTGSSGFIGEALARQLIHDGWCVDVVDVKPPKNDLIGKGAQRTFQVSFDDPIVLTAIMQGDYDVVFHQAAIPRVSYSVQNPIETTDTNVLKTLRLFDACKAGGVERIVFASSSSVYGDVDESDLPLVVTMPRNPASPYALQKAFIEQHAVMAKRFYEQDIVCLRYFNVYGPGQLTGGAYSTVIPAWCEAIRDGKSLRLDGTGEQTRDFAYIDDVVRANILAANSDDDLGGKIFNIAGGERVSLLEILDWFRERFDVTVEVAPFREGDIMHTLAGLWDSKEKLGYEPQVDFVDGLQRTIEWWGLHSAGAL